MLAVCLRRCHPLDNQYLSAVLSHADTLIWHRVLILDIDTHHPALPPCGRIRTLHPGSDVTGAIHTYHIHSVPVSSHDRNKLSVLGGMGEWICRPSSVSALEPNSVFRYPRRHHGCPRLLMRLSANANASTRCPQTCRHDVACHPNCALIMKFVSSPSPQANHSRGLTQDFSSASATCPDPLLTSLPLFRDTDVNRRPIIYDGS